MLMVNYIGNTTNIPGWPENTIDGLFDALERWTLDRRLDMSKEPALLHDPLREPFRGRAWCGCKEVRDPVARTIRYFATRPIHPEAPDAVAYLGNFLEASWVFSLDTDDADLITRLDAAIAKNMLMPAYIEAVSKIRRDAATLRQAAARLQRYQALK